MTTSNLPPTLDTDGLALDLVTGHYRFAFSNFQSPDRSDSIRLELATGAASYNLGDGWVSLEPSLELDFEYFDRASNDIEIRIEADAQLTLQTREGWAYPYDDAPTHPIASWAYDRLDEPDPEEMLLADLNAAAATNAIAYPIDEADTLGSAVLRSARTDLRTDGDEVSVERLQQDFFHGQVDLTGYGVSGSAGLWTTQPGINKVTLDLRGDYDRANLLFWNGQSLVSIDPTYISNSTIDIYIDAVADEWGFALLDSENSGDDTDLRVSSIEWIAEAGDFDLGGGYIANADGLLPADSIGNARIEGDAVTLSTGQFDRAASSLGNWVAGNREFFNPWGTEGSAVTYTNLEPGVYKFDRSMYSADRDGNDILLAWNGRDLVEIGDRASGTQISPARWAHDPIAVTVEVVYDSIAFIALDQIDKRGTTDFTISGFQRTGDLGYEPPQRIDITPDILTGDVNLKDGYTGIATGTGDRAISTISDELVGETSEESSQVRLNTYNSELGELGERIREEIKPSRLIVSDYPNSISPGVSSREAKGAISTLNTELIGDSPRVSPRGAVLETLGTEGSYATWEVESGTYEVTWSLYASEDDINRDAVYFWNGSAAEPFATRASATIQSSATRWISPRQVSTVEASGGQLTFLAVDEIDKSGTTEIRVYGIEKIASSPDASTQNPSTENDFNPIVGYPGEPPYPIPDNGWDMGDDASLAWDMGILKPWETDEMTGIEWNQGYVYPTYHLGTSYINETIGGDDVTDWATFVLEEASYLNVFHSNAIAEVVDESRQVVVGSNDAYNGNLKAFLEPGRYDLHFSSESSVPEAFGAQIYLSNSDPNYAD